MRVDLIHPHELDDGAQAEWLALRAAAPAYASPYFHPAFAIAVGAVRADARILIIEDGGRRVGFWGLHRRPDGFARPLGQPLADENGPVLDLQADVNLPAALRAARIGAAAFTGLPVTSAACAPFVTELGETARIDLKAGGMATLSALRAEHASHFKNMRRKDRKAVEQYGDIAFVATGQDQAVLAQLIDWKRAQFARTGMYDVFAPSWTRALMAQLANAQAPAFCGQLSSLHLGGQLAAAEFSLRSAGHLHAWITAYDTQYSGHSPGHLMQIRMIEQADNLGLTVIDIGVGAGHYKRFYANASAPLAQGVAPAAGLVGAVHSARSRLWRAAEANPVHAVAGAFGRLRRRSEIIMSADQSLSGRIGGLMQAVRDASMKPGEAAG